MKNRRMSTGFMFMVTCIFGATAAGETIRFDPTSQSLESGATITTLTFDLYLESTSSTTTFNSIDLLIGSNTVAVTSFTFDANFLSLLDFSSNARADQMASYNSAILAGGFSATGQNRSVLIGTVTVDAANLNVGSYNVAVSADTDVGISNVALGDVSEPLNGSATITLFNPTTAACQADADCDDTLSCTTDACVGGVCNHTPIDGCTDTSTPPDTGGTDTPDGGVQAPVLCGATGMIPLIFTLFFLTLLRKKTL